MYSPRNSYDHTANDDLNSLMQPMTEQLNLINIYDGVPQQHKNNSVDSLLIHNTPSPPQSFINYPNFTHNNANNQPVSYRKVRPEPISDKTLVGSVVGFFQDVVGGDTSKHHHPSNVPTNHHHHQSSSSTVSEIKEQIEWLHFEHVNMLINTNLSSGSSFCTYSSNSTSSSSNSNNNNNNNNSNTNTPFANSNILLVIGYKTGFSIWTIDMNGVATEALSIKEPNITHVKLLQLETTNRLLVAICKLLVNDDTPPQPPTSSLDQDDLNDDIASSASSQAHSPSSTNNQIPQKKYKISIINLLNGECVHETVFNGNVIELKSNSDLLCVNSWNRIDAFDLNTFEHRFSINSCYSQVSQSTGQVKNPFSLGHRWLAFADNKFHTLLGSIGGVSTGIEQSYTATVFNTAKSISKGLVTVVNSVVSKSKSSSSGNSSSSNNHSPRLNGVNMGSKTRHDSKEEYQSGIITIVDTKKYLNNGLKQTNLHDENQNWIIAHFMAHHEPIYAIEFNNNGRLMCTADILGQYFHVFQINANAFKSTRTVVKHLYSLYRGDTNAKLRNISFSNDSRWLAISTKRGTTHIFPINSYGGPVNARTHSKPYVVNRTSKHQRTAGFGDQDGGDIFNANLNLNEQMQQMLQQNYDNSCVSPIVINNNPKLKSLLEPHVIPAFGQLKQPNANSPFQSSIISTNAQPSSASGLLTAVSLATQQINNTINGTASSNTNNTGNSSEPISYATAATSLVGIAGSNLAASALSSAALVTENVTNFASNTTNMIQYDNVTAVAIFAESRGYLTPDEPRDLYKLKPANSLFVISDANGNLVEYVLDIVVDTSKSIANKPTNDCPIQLKITPKAQWPLQRIITADEVNYPIQSDNPLLKIGLNNQVMANNKKPISNQFQNDSYNSFNSFNGYTTAPNSFAPSTTHSLQLANSSNNDWIRQIEVNTHMGPHRRLFMGPQFVFKTFNSNLTTTMLNPTSSSVMSDVETPIIDLAGNLELNSLDLTSTTANRPTFSHHSYTSTNPMKIGSSSRSSLKKFDCTPTFIEVGAGSFQEGMPILCGQNGILRGSQKSLNNQDITTNDNNLIESIADAMNESNNQSSSSNHSPNVNMINKSSNKMINHSTSINKTPAIVIANRSNDLLINANQTASSSIGSNSSGVFTVGSYFMVNPSIPNVQSSSNGPTVNTSLTSFTSSSSASSSSSSSRSSTNSNNDDTDSIHSTTTHVKLIHNGEHYTNTKPSSRLLTSSSSHHKVNDASSLDNIPFQPDDDQPNLLH